MFIKKKIIFLPFKFLFMKTHINIRLNIKKMLFFICLLFISCASKSQDLSQKIENAIGENLFVSFNGNVFARQLTNNTLLIAYKAANDPKGSFDKAFILMSENNTSSFSFSENENYKVFIPANRRYAVVYNTVKNQIFFIGLNEDATKNKIASFKANSSLKGAVLLNQYLGFGVSYVTGTWDGSKIKNSTYIDPFNILASANMNQTIQPALVDPGSGGVSCAQGTCTSGGAGSTSCSIGEGGGMGSCSVNCTSGYYACCVSSSVRCYCCKN